MIDYQLTEEQETWVRTFKEIAAFIRQNAERVREERIARNRAVWDNREFLIEVLPHGRTSCSDQSPTNGHTTVGRGGYPRCTKCMLMELSEVQLGDVELSLELHGRYLFEE